MMSEGKTIGQLMEEMRAKAGAQNYHGHVLITKLIANTVFKLNCTHN